MKALLWLIALSTSLWAWGGSGFLPHVAADRASFATDIALENQTANLQTIYLTAFDQNGNPLASTSLSVTAQTRFIRAVDALFPDQDVAYLRYDAPARVTADIIYTPKANPANRAVVSGSPQEAFTWRIYPGNWTTTFDGLAIIHGGCGGDTQVSFKQYDAQGNWLDQTTLQEPLAPRQKIVVDLADLFSNNTDGYVEISGEYALHVMALKGTRDPLGEQAYLLAGNVEPQTDFPDLYQAVMDNQAKWQSQETTSTYEMKMQYLCFCPEDVVQPVHLDVTGGQIQTMTYVENGANVPLSLVPRYRTVEQLFQLILDHIEQGVDGIRAEFDADRGYPTEIHIDPNSCVADEEFSFRVLSVEAPTNE